MAQSFHKKWANYEGTSRPKARDSLRYPCPAEWSVYGSLQGKEGFSPEGGQSPVDPRGICMSVPRAPETAAQS